MKETLKLLNFDAEEIEKITMSLSNVTLLQFNQIINLFYKYKCDKNFIKEVIISRKDIFEYDVIRLEYIFDAIISNNDIIEETLLEII